MIKIFTVNKSCVDEMQKRHETIAKSLKTKKLGSKKK